jgi:hypothetical protein
MNIYDPSEKRTVTPERARKILAKYGTLLSEEETKMMLDFLYKLSNLSVSQALNRAKQYQFERPEAKRTTTKRKSKNDENC